MIKGKHITVFLLVAVALSLLLAFSAGEFRLPGNDQGYEPPQPIAFSHRLHAGELEVPCLYCHSGARKSRNAGIPPAQLCMNCHKSVQAPFAQVRAEAAAAEKEKRKPGKIVSPELRKLYTALGLDDSLSKDPSVTPAPVAWRRVHNLPDFVYFDHRPHTGAGVACQACHGPVEAMERVRQHSTLTMGWCLDCHRGTPAAAAPGGGHSHVTTDCSRCHY
ncbi:MAG: cytochrome c3 family protein [Elusimicrobia bacterium]|nr:cytochrome c3 family protein [Elusimicrobiota bacterium]